MFTITSSTTPTPKPIRSIALKGPAMLIGTGGMLARAWVRLLNQQGIQFTAPPVADVNITKPDTIRRFINDDYPLVINCAGWTNVDGAETNEDAASAINAQGASNLAQRCKELGAFLVHYSTDYVFAGDASTPYPTDHPRKPLGAYARGKAKGEKLVEDSGCDYLMVRTSWLYAPWGNNFVRTISKIAKQKPELKVVNDQRGRPTSAEHLAQTTLKLLQAGAAGTFHVTDGGECTWFDFAKKIAAHSSPACKVLPCPSSEYPSPVKRPAYSVLDITKTESLVGPMPHWEKNLADVLPRLEP